MARIDKDGLGEYWEYIDTDYLNYARSGKKKDKKNKPSDDPPPDNNNDPEGGDPDS